MRVMIAYPPLQGKGSPMLTQNRQFQWFHEPSYLYPCVPASAATLLAHHGHEVCWVDCIAERKSWGHFERLVRDFEPDLVAMETKTPVVRQHWEVAARLKAIAPGVRIALMGDHVTARPRETLERSPVDYAITGGDYDFSLRRLVDHLEQGADLGPGFTHRNDGEIVDTGPFVLGGDLTELPWIDRDLTKAHLYFEKWKRRVPFMWTMAGRDCPHHRCTFCSWASIWPEFRVVPPDHLAAEMAMLVDRYGAREIFDDTGTLPGGVWLEQLADAIVARGLDERVLFDCNFRFDQLTEQAAHDLARAGFRKLLVGLESASQRTLDILDKGLCREQILEGARVAAAAGLQLQITLMVGYPWETREDAMQTLALARQLLYEGLAHHLQATVVVPYPGTPLHELCLRHGWFRFDPEDWDRYDMTEPTCSLTDMSPEEVVQLAGQFYRLYLDPRFVARQLAGLRSVEDLDYLARGAKAIWGHVRDFATERSGRTA